VNTIRPKVTGLRLDPIAYENLQHQVLRRDGWRCQACGTMANLDVHHKVFRSHAGDDSELNLITLCTACHAQTHRADSTSTLFTARKLRWRSLKNVRESSEPIQSRGAGLLAASSSLD